MIGFPFLGSLGSITDVASGETWSDSELLDHILRRRDVLLSSGVREGDRVMILHSNSSGFFADIFAVWLLGGCAVCLDPEIGVAEFDRVTSHAGAKFAIISGGCPPKLNLSASNLKFVDPGAAEASHPTRMSERWPRGSILDRDALILYTSGSTGTPKGIVHTFRTLQTKWFILEHYVPLEFCSRTLCALPTYFGHGLICNALYPLVHGCHLVVLPKSNVAMLATLGSIIDDYRITFMSSVPSMWKVVLRTSNPPGGGSLRQVHVGSAPLLDDVWEDIRRWTNVDRVWNIYGLTETGSWIAGTNDETVEPASGLVGRGWGCEILVSSSDETTGLGTHERVTDLRVPEGEPGHVWLRTPCIMRGYLNDDAQTDRVMSGSWFFTGDTGYIDDRGRLVLVGRTRSEINKGGIKVAPESIDAVMERHPAISEACAFGVDDAILGQNVAISVVLDLSAGIPPKAVELMRWCSSQLSDYMTPAFWYRLSDLPRTTTGKVDRLEVAKLSESLERMR